MDTMRSDKKSLQKQAPASYVFGPAKTYTITHKKITKWIPEQFRFGNSTTQITEHNSKNNSVRDSEILCSHFLPRPSNSRNSSVR